nr:transposase [Streptomyces antimycoticus]
MNEAHARHVLAAYERHYNEHRPHQARNQLPPDAHKQPAAADDLHTHRVERIRILGGLINSTGMTCSDDFSSGTGEQRTDVS